MLYSSNHNFIFLHLPKTAGTSITDAISALASDHLDPYRGGTAHHLSALAARDLFSETWTNCYKFSFVRNPWDRCVSFYHYLHDRIDAPWLRDRLRDLSFKDFILNLDIPEAFKSSHAKCEIGKEALGNCHCEHCFNLANYGKEWNSLWRDGTPWSQTMASQLTEAGTLLVDFVGKYEHLHRDVRTVSDAIGFDIQLPHLNKTNHCEYWKYYDAESQLRVAEIFQEDIEFFGYKFRGKKF